MSKRIPDTNPEAWGKKLCIVYVFTPASSEYEFEDLADVVAANVRIVKGLEVQVRNNVAEQLYLHIIGQQDTSIPEDVADLLLETPWSDDFAAAKAAQARITSLLNLKVS